MNGHPGGTEHTRRMIALADLPEGACVLDMGAGSGEAVRLLRAAGIRPFCRQQFILRIAG